MSREKEIFFKVRRPDGLFYNPDKSNGTATRYEKDGKRFFEKNFDKKGKKYSKRGYAERAVVECASELNNGWTIKPFQMIYQTPFKCEIVTFESITTEK